MDVVELADLDDDQRAAMEEGEADPFGNEGDGPGLQWRDKDLYVALQDRDGSLVARAGLLVDRAQAGETAFELVGLGDVLVSPSRRRRGLALRVVTAALERAAHLGPAVAVLFCDEGNMGLYARAGFRPIEAPVTAGQPDGPVVMPMEAMWAPLRPGAAWPPGDVAIDGLPF